jgi:hypothetical protein
MKSYSTNKKLIAELRNQLDQAQATILSLKQLLRAQGRYLHEEIKLSPTQRKVVDILLQTDGISTKEHLYDALYASKQGHAPHPKILREIIRLIRKKLKSHEIEIRFCRLPAICPLDEALHRDLPPKIASELYHAGRIVSRMPG